MYPVQRSESDQSGDAALLEDEASDKLLLDSRTPHRVRRATVTLRKLCGGVCGLGGVPGEVTSQNERFVTDLSTAHLQPA